MDKNKTMQTTDDILFNLSKYGRPRVSMQLKGWYAAIDIIVNKGQPTLTIDTEMNMNSPNEAAADLLDKIIAV